MELNEIRQKSIFGAKWLVLLSAISLPLGYVSNIILGRISPQALGTYGIINIFITIIVTFILFGGGTVLIKYLPEVGNPRQRSFILGYLLLALGISVPFILLFLYYPQILNPLLSKAVRGTLSKYIVLIVPIVIIKQIVISSLSGLMEIKVSAIIQKVGSFGQFLIFAFLFLVFRDFFSNHYESIIWITYFVLLISTALFGLSFLIRKLQTIKEKWNLKPFLPQGFWKFGLFVHASSLLVFVYDQGDKLFIFGYFETAELGLYLAALNTALLIRFVPQLLAQILLPTFSNLLASKEEQFVQKAYYQVIRFNTLIIVPLGLACIFFSRQIMTFFGPEYIKNDFILVILAMFYSFSAIGTVAPSLIIAKGKTGWYFLTSVIQVIFQFLFTIFFIKNLGPLGAVIGKGGGLVIAQFGLAFISCRIINMNLKIPRAYFVGVVTTLLSVGFWHLFSLQNLFISSALFVGCFLIFLLAGEYTLEDINSVFRQLKWK